AAPDDLRRPRRAFRQQVAEALPPRDLLDHLHHRVGIAEAQVEPVRVLGGEQPVLEAVHRPGNGRAARDRVHTVHTAELVGVGHRPEVVYAAVGAEGRDGFVLRPAVARIDAVRAVRHLDHPLAADGAGVAGIALLEDFAGHRLAVERPPPLEDATRPVARGQPADILLSLDDLRRAQLAERPALRLGEDLRTVPCQLVQTLA